MLPCVSPGCFQILVCAEMVGNSKVSTRLNQASLSVGTRIKQDWEWGWEVKQSGQEQVAVGSVRAALKCACLF